MDCYDTGGPEFFSNCGDYGVCAGACQGPTVRTREETVPTGSIVTGIFCHYDHWYWGDPYASPRYYNYMIFVYRIDTIRVTTNCDGTVTEEVIDSRNTSSSCAQRTWSTCYSPFGPPPLTCL
ncbi:MAG: hypothetical protein AAGC60_17760 [Acidobacteriota bacterium]